MTTPGKSPVVFVHGLWLHATSWAPWLDRFAAAGYSASAPGWPGDAATVAQARANPDQVAGVGVDDVVSHYAALCKDLPARPIVIGHSFGGLIAQRLLTQGAAVAAVAIDPAPIKGVLALPLSALRVASIVLRNPLNRGRAVALTREQFRYGFGNALSADESDELYEKWSIPSPGKPLFEAAFAAFAPKSPVASDTRTNERGPLLITAGGKDHTVPASVSHTTKKLYRHSSAVTDVVDFADRGHSLSIDSGWGEVADAALTWLEKQGL
jgi:pimeloyl-ACP methyl ester carboxylesterase